MMGILEKIDNKLSEVVENRVDFRITTISNSQALLKLFIGVYEDTSIKELQQADRKLMATQKKMEKEINDYVKGKDIAWRPKPQKTSWVQTSQHAMGSVGPLPLSTAMALVAFIELENLNGMKDVNQLYTILHKHRG